MSKLREAAQAVVAYHDAMYEGAMSDAAIDRLRAALAKPETDAPRDEWRPAGEPPKHERRVIAWRSPPQRQSGTWAEALYDDGAWVTRDGIAHDITHWRDVTPPTEGAK